MYLSNLNFLMSKYRTNSVFPLGSTKYQFKVPTQPIRKKNYLIENSHITKPPYLLHKLPSKFYFS